MRIQKMWICAVIFAAALAAAGCGSKETGTAAQIAVDGHIPADGAETGVTVPGGAKTGATAPGGGEDTIAAAADETAADETAVPDGTTEADGTAMHDATAAVQEVVEEGMTPIHGNQVKDGVYQVKTDSSSNMFKITVCELTVKNGAMTAVMTMSGTGYLKLFMGTGEEALTASEGAYIPYVEAADGTHTFEVPVEALDMGIDCSAFSKNKEKWYDRVLVFRADSLPMEAFAEGTLTTAGSLKLEDGRYTAEVALGGGSGRASVESPAALRVEDGKIYATITWGSANYDYMKVGDEKFDLIDTEGNSTFEIPVGCFDWKLPVIADTIAMSQPHEVAYTLTFDSATLEQVN